jgi:hypothetical protein
MTKAVAAAVVRNVRLTICAAMNCHSVCVNAVASVPRLMPTTAVRNTRRRPSRSTNGITRNAGNAPSRTHAVSWPASACASPKDSRMYFIAEPSIERS